MQLPQRGVRFLLSRSLSGPSSVRKSADLPVVSWNPSSPLPLPPRKPNIPAAHFSKLRSIPTWSDLSAPFVCAAAGRRVYCTGLPAEDYSKEVDEINLKFAEAREEIDAALESKDTVYFDEEAECAREAVKLVLDMFGGLMARLPEKERAALQRSMGLKIEQLKAELGQLDD